MKTNQIDLPEYTQRELKITDFYPYTDFGTNLLVGAKLSSIRHKVDYLRNGPNGTQNAYFVGNRLFFYANQYIYEYKNYSASKLEACEALPIMIPILYEGKEEILVIIDTTAYILGKSQTSFTLPQGSYYVNYGNRLFVAKDRNVYFSGDFDVDNMTMDISNSGYVSVPLEDGNVLGLFTYQDDLIIFCQKGIYNLKILSNGDFTLTRYNTFVLNVKANSIAQVGDKIYFISNDKLCSFDSSAVKRLKVKFENLLSNTNLKAFAYEEYYSIRLTVSSEEYLYMYNTETEEVQILPTINCDYVGGKYLFNKTSRELYILNRAWTNSGEWTSVEMDFGCYSQKEITEINLRVSKGAMLFVYSDTGYRSFVLEEGNNCKKMNFKGKKFYFLITITRSSTIIEDFKIKYKITGE